MEKVNQKEGAQEGRAESLKRKSVIENFFHFILDNYPDIWDNVYTVEEEVEPLQSPPRGPERRLRRMEVDMLASLDFLIRSLKIRKVVVRKAHADHADFLFL